MFDFDSLNEIWSTVRKNKLRTALTGFSVAWGIFMLISLLGAGNGLANGQMNNFRSFNKNRYSCWTGWVNTPFKGFSKNREVRLHETFMAELPLRHPEIDAISPSNGQSVNISFGEEFIASRVYGVYPSIEDIEGFEFSTYGGRFVNELDQRDRRKSIVLSPRIADVLFRDGVDPIGQQVKVDNIVFIVVGVFDERNNDNEAKGYISYEVGNLLYGWDSLVDDIVLTAPSITTEEADDAFKKRIRATVAEHGCFDPDDTSALGVWSMGSNFRMFQTMQTGISLFIWIIGIGTLMAGIVGVSNIMLITVRERTREFGIRKALGARPRSILSLVIAESVAVTACFGYLGMLLGVGLTELIAFIIENKPKAEAVAGSQGPSNMTMFMDPTVDLNIAISATVVIVIAGVLAGYFPARKAVKVSPIEAMRAE